MSNTKVKNYIEKHWNETIKFNPNDNDTLLGLPFPYCVPSVGNFDEMYYWDTYFTDKGLAISGKMYQVRNNTRFSGINDLCTSMLIPVICFTLLTSME